MPIKPRRYFDYVEKRSEKVGIKWKCLHIMVFLLISLNSFASAIAFQNIFDTFNYRCCLYAKTTIKLDPYFEISNTTTTGNDSLVNVNNSDPAALIFRNADYDPLINFNNKLRFRSGENFKLANVSNMEIRDGELWFVNETCMGKIHMDMLRTIFATLLMCDLVLFVPLIAIVISVVLAVMVMLCGRGGGGRKADLLPQPWIIVYPLIAVSAVMAILCIISTNTVKNGLETFCSRFEEFTGRSECSSLMDYLTIQHGHGKRPYYHMYLICYYSYNFSTILWLFQLGLGLFRVVCVVDFQLRSVVIRNKKHDIAEDDEVLWSFAPTPKLHGIVEMLKKKKKAEAEENARMLSD